MSDLQQQLADLRARVARISAKYDAKDAKHDARWSSKFSTRDSASEHEVAEHTQAAVEEWLGGEAVETAYGRHFETEKLYERPPAARQRRHRLAGGITGRSADRDLRRRYAPGLSVGVGVSRHGNHGTGRRERYLRVSGWHRKNHAGRFSRAPVLHAGLLRGGQPARRRGAASGSVPGFDHLQRENFRSAVAGNALSIEPQPPPVRQAGAPGSAVRRPAPVEIAL